jgi:hypothetical protein
LTAAGRLARKLWRAPSWVRTSDLLMVRC